MEDREYAYFSVMGLGKHQVITDRLGWKPSNAFSEGDKKPRSGIYSNMVWSLDSGLDKSEPLEKHIDILLVMLGTKATLIRELLPDYRCYINCVGNYYSSQHGVHISSELVWQASHLGISFDLDFYYCGEE